MSNQNWAEYNCLDGATTNKCWGVIEKDLIQQGYLDYYEETMQLFPIVLFMMTRGLRVDQDALDKVIKETANEIALKEEELNARAGEPLNALSPKQCFTYFYGKLGHAPYKNAQGNPTTDDKAMARLFRKGVYEAKLVQEIRGLNKMKGTYYEVLTDEDGRLRSSFNLRGTVTGRLSSSKTIFGTGGNFQNLPPAFKRFIVSDEGKLFIEFDKEQSEWIIAAYASGDPRMIAAIESGADIHAITANMITGVPIPLIKKEAELIGESTDQDWIFAQRMDYLGEVFQQSTFLPRSMSCRQAGKKSNHGLNYYMGYRRFAMENEIPETESKIMVEGYRANYSCLPIWWNMIEHQLSRDRTITNCFGHKRRFLDEWGHALLTSAIAHIPQSTNVTLINRAMVKNYHDNQDYMQPLEQLAQVHDSILTQYPIGQWKSLAKTAIRVHNNANPTLEYGGREFNIKTAAKIGLNWGQTLKIPIVTNVNEMADRLEEAYGEITQ